MRTLQLLGLKEGEFIPGHSKMFLKAWPTPNPNPNPNPQGVANP